MNTRRFIHQQIMQLKWHFLACLGLIMVLPLEEAVVNFKAGDGFYSSGLTALAIGFSPLLAALLACSNVQADLDEKRDIFWRSKPVSIGRFIMGKFVLGLLLSLLILVCPFLFSWVSTAWVSETLGYHLPYVAGLSLVLLLTYSVCFFCNVLIRKTAQAWLIGVAVTLLSLLLTCILPLNIKDITTDFVLFKSMMILFWVVTLGLSGVMFIGAILAVRRNWQFHTNLRSLLWGGAALIFILALLLGHQMTNIKVLDEKTIISDDGDLGGDFLNRSGKLIMEGYPTAYEVSTNDGTLRIQPRTVDLEDVRQRARRFAPYDVPKELRPHFDFAWTLGRQDSRFESVSYRVGQENYSFVLKSYYRSEKGVTRHGTEMETRRYERAYFHCNRLSDGGGEPVSFLDLSDYVQWDKNWWTSVCLVKDKAIVILNKTCLVVDISDPTSMAVIEQKTLKRHPIFIRSELGVFDLLPLETLDREDRIKLSIALADWDARVFTDLEGHISYVLSDRDKIARYDVVEIDGNQIHCQRRDERRVTPLERIGSFWINERVLCNGRLYLRSENCIMVFDVTGLRIRKLGHFERFSSSFYISEMEVLDDGNILLLVDKTQNSVHLALLKNPQ